MGALRLGDGPPLHLLGRGRQLGGEADGDLAGSDSLDEIARPLLLDEH
jgi:hypothetical protein